MPRSPSTAPPMLVALALAAGWLGPGCAGTDPGARAADERPREAAKDGELSEPVDLRLARQPWPDSFEEEAFLLARTIRVEGPPGLLEHAVLLQDPLVADYTARSRGDALVQELEPKEGAGPVRGHLDNWTLVAEERLTIVRRDSGVSVVVRADGEAVWRSVATGEERRAPRLEFAREAR